MINFHKWFSADIGIDLGTSNTLVYLADKGIVLNEPSVVALNQKTEKVVAVGLQAKQMLGRTPSHIKAVRPLVDGVISDFEVTEEMMSYLLRKVQTARWNILGPRVIVGVPSGITNVEIRAVRDAARSAGAREVHIVEEPMATAVGIRLPVKEPVGTMVIDLGGGTSDIAVISLGGVVQSKNLRVAGDQLNQDIINYVRSEFKILIGEKTAENTKIAIAMLTPAEEPLEATIKGRDLVTGLPREVVVTDADMREALSQSIDNIIESAKEVLETTPPEVLSDVMQRGVYLAGGGALIRGLSSVLEEHIKVPVYVADDPLTSVARGAGVILEDLENYQEVLIEHEDELSPQK